MEETRDNVARMDTPKAIRGDFRTASAVADDPRVTTDDTLARDLRASLNLRSGIPAGLTWGDFQAAMKLLGVKDGDRIASIEYGCGQYGSGCVQRDDAADGIEIRERR